MTNIRIHTHKAERLSVFVENLVKKEGAEGEQLSVGELIDALHEKGHMLICMIFAAPFLLPIPLPGLSTVFGAVIFLGAIQLIRGRDPWLPDRWRVRNIPKKMVNKTFLSLAGLLRRIEFIFKPRFLQLINAKYADQMNGFVLLILAVLLALPMPPGFNAPPAAAIILLSIGTLEEDGLATIVAWVFTLLNIAFFSGFFILGYQGVAALFHL